MQLNPASVGQDTMMFSSKQNLAQGTDYQRLHEGQHGGGGPMYVGAPVGTTGVLPADLNAAARIGPTLDSLRAIQGMQDGGARRKKRGTKRSAKKRGTKRSAKKRSRRSRRKMMYGGAATALGPADYSSPGTILPPAMERVALSQMNPEMAMIEKNPMVFSPRVA